MSHALRQRLRHLEQELEQLTGLWERMPPNTQRDVVDRCVLFLIRHGLVPPPDPAHPHSAIAALRHTHQEQLEALRQTIMSPPWQRAHRATWVALCLRELKRVASTR